MQNIYSTRLKRTVRPGDVIRPVFSPPAPGSNAVPVPDPDETVIGVEAGLVDRLTADGAASGWTGQAPRRFIPGYGLADLGDPAPFLGGGLAAFAAETAQAGRGVEPPQPEEQHPVFQAAERAYQLKLQKRRMSLVGTGVALTELGLDHLVDTVPRDVAIGVDILQVALGGAKLAHAIEANGVGVRSAIPTVELAADVINAAGHVMPGLKHVLPYTKVLSLGLKFSRDLIEVPEYEAPDAAAIARWTRDHPDETCVRIDLLLDPDGTGLPRPSGN